MFAPNSAPVTVFMSPGACVSVVPVSSPTVDKGSFVTCTPSLTARSWQIWATLSLERIFMSFSRKWYQCFAQSLSFAAPSNLTRTKGKQEDFAQPAGRSAPNPRSEKSIKHAIFVSYIEASFSPPEKAGKQPINSYMDRSELSKYFLHENHRIITVGREH